MKVVGIILAILIGLIGLFMSGCGGLFLIASLGDSGTLGVVAIALPCFLVGAGFIWAAVAVFRSVTRVRPPATPGDSPP